MDDNFLKENHPQKYYLRLASRALYYLGFGTYWYENLDSRYPRLYPTWCIFVNVYMAVVVVDEALTFFRTDLAKEEKYEGIQLGFGNLIILFKTYLMVVQKYRIRRVLKRLLEDEHNYMELDRQAVKKSMAIIGIFAFMCYTYLSLITLHKVFVSYRDGTPLQSQLTYFPTSADIGFFYGLLRVLILCHCWWLMTTMFTAHCLCFMCLIFVATKFKQTHIYFEELKEKRFQREEFKDAFAIGIGMHENALWCASNVQSALGNVYSVQVCQATVLLGFCLLEAVALEKTLENLMYSVVYMSSLSLLTGLYMISSDDITHEASKVSTSMFHCGWEDVHMDRGLRAVLIVAIQRAQQPVYMTAFGVIVLSRQNFIGVLRAAYSFFALVY